MRSQYTKTVEQVEGRGTAYGLPTPGGAVSYRLTVSQTMHASQDRSGVTHEKKGAREIRGFIAAPDLRRCFGRPFTLRLEDGRTLDLLVTDDAGTVRGIRDFYVLEEGETPGYDVRRRPGPHMGYR
jgi:hypothetical protein